MTAKQLAEVERLFHEASARPSAEWDAFLDQACAGDELLRRQVRALLDQSISAPASPAPQSDRGDLAGAHVGSYNILRRLGAGGMGEVYLAIDTKLGRSVAVKLLSRNLFEEGARSRFQSEARLASSLNHPHLVTVHDAGEFEGRPYLVTEFVDGGTLRDWAGTEPRSWQQVVDLLTGVADGLASAHSAGIAHRDIKPENILVTTTGYAKLADFGLAKLLEVVNADAVTAALDSPQTTTGAVMGTLGYMSPEQASGKKVDSRSDIFSFGIVLHELLSGRRPFAAETTIDELHNIVHRAPTPLSDQLPLPLRMIVAKALEKNPAERHQTMSDMVVDLRRLSRDGSSDSSLRATPAVVQRFGVSAAVAGAVVVIIGLIGAGVWFGRGPSKPAATPDVAVAEAVRGAEPAFDIEKVQLTKEDRLIVADFVNKTEEQVFDDTLREALGVKLEQSNVVRPMSPGQVERLLEQLRLKPDTRVTPELARDICIRAGEKATLTGSITALGKTYVLLLTATNCRTAEVLATAQAQAEGKERVLNALSEAVDAMREELGEKLAGTQKPGGHETLPITTASLEAYRAYALGLELLRREKLGEANAYYRRAREIDPKFAWAWLSEYRTAENAGRAMEEEDLLTNAYKNRRSAGEVERLMVEAVYAERIQQNPEKKRELLEHALQLAPNTGFAQNELGNLYATLGNRKRSTELHEQFLEYHADFVAAYLNLASDYVTTGRFRDARGVLIKGAEAVGIADLHRRLLRIAYLEGDQAAIEKETPLAETESEVFVQNIRREYAYATGRFKEADALGNRGDTATGPLRRAFAEDCSALPATGANPFALLRCGDHERAVLRALKDLEDSNLTPPNARTLRADVSIGRGEPQEVVKELGPLVRVDSPDYRYLSVLSIAFMDLNRPADAANVLRKQVSRSNLFQASFPRAHVELARALSAAGNKAGAKKAYEAFFQLWKDADADIPLLTNAKKEYAALQ